MRAAVLGAVVILGAAVVGWYRRPVEVEGAIADASASDSWLPAAEDLLADVEAGISALIPVRALMWSPEKVPVKYRAAIAAAEDRNGIPDNMLARLLYQESRFREDVITGKVKSRVGALGIAQFMPATAAEWGVDPLDPFEAIDGAGRYLAWLYRRVGTWAGALAAYNWGIGNVLRKGLAAAPVETRNYFGQILADLGLGEVVA